MTVETYDYHASNGRYVRRATRVVFPSGGSISFTERISKKKALATIEQYRQGFPQERRLVIAAENGAHR